MTKILLIEDNQQIAKNIKQFLELEEGREVSCSYDGEKGLMMAKMKEYDCIVLDLMLPSLDGKTICQSIRSFKSCPVIIISAKSQLDDKLELFETGADDYLIKPFDLEELLARIKALLRRGVSPTVYAIGDLYIDINKREIQKAREVVHLTLKEFQLLELLLQHQGTSLSRTDIVAELWGEDAIWESDARLDVYISNIRKKLDKDLIVTVKGYGYTLGKSFNLD